MNRLIILGNGFDLAHGLKTGYTDFMLDLLKDEVLESFSKSEVNDYKDLRTYSKGTIRISRKGNRRFDAAVEERICKIDSFEELKEFLREFSIEITTNREDSIFGQTYKNLKTYNWADIEAIYYDSLVNIVEHNNKRKLADQYKADVITLNQELDFFRNRLIQYLGKVQSAPRRFPSGGYFWGKIKDKGITGEYPGNIHILNFNYTNTINNYGYHANAYGDSNSAVEFNSIHGSLNEPESIIFGYGDEVDRYYKKMEDLNDKELLRHAKSFGYFRNNRYRKFLNFLSSGKYEVWVIGHSCGLSDRVMLKKIFEHENCVSIKLIHYKKGNLNDHFEKTQEISRHFDNKELMRERIEFFQDEDNISNLLFDT